MREPLTVDMEEEQVNDDIGNILGYRGNWACDTDVALMLRVGELRPMLWYHGENWVASFATYYPHTAIALSQFQGYGKTPALAIARAYVKMKQRQDGVKY